MADDPPTKPIIPITTTAPSKGDFPWLKRRVSGFTISPRLPDHLLEKVVSYCDSPTLATLARCNTEVHAVAIPALYRTILIAKNTLGRLLKNETLSDEQAKWIEYKIECCRLVKAVIVLGDISDDTISARLPRYSTTVQDIDPVEDFDPHRIDQVPVVFPNVTDLCMWNAPVESLHQCVHLFQPTHLCVLNPPLNFDIGKVLWVGKIEDKQYSDFRLSVKSLTIHSSTPVWYPCMGSFVGHSLRLIHPSWIYDPILIPPPRLNGLWVPIRPLSTEVVGGHIPTNSELIQLQNLWGLYIDTYVDHFGDELRAENRDLTGRMAFTATDGAPPCIVCGTLFEYM